MISGVIAAWREVKAIVLGLIGVVLLMAWLRKWPLAILTTGLLGWVFYFFRDPERQPDSMAQDLIIAPADGRVMSIELVDEPHFFHGQAKRVAVFMSVLDVHVQHSPFSGVVKFLRYQAGSFKPAFLKDTAENEYNFIGLETRFGLFAIKQIAGILARRVVCWVKIDDELSRGQRMGLIRFGSRVDLFLPPETAVLVRVGQHVYGGQTVMARWSE